MVYLARLTECCYLPGVDFVASSSSISCLQVRDYDVLPCVCVTEGYGEMVMTSAGAVQ